MRRLLPVALCTFAVGAMGAGSADIRVEGPWPGTDPAELRTMLTRFADPLLEAFDATHVRVLVRHRDFDDPKVGARVLFETTASGERIVELSARDRHWRHFAYQFSHELCHILSNYHHSAWGQSAWFDETLCEVASLYTVRALAKPGAPGDFAAYYDHIAAEPHRTAARDKPVARWLRENRETLLGDAVDRARNEWLAMRLLPLFERHPQAFASLAGLNTDDTSCKFEIEGRLRNWRKKSPKHRALIEEIIRLFGFVY